jgi:hypothetical protein
VTEVVQEEDAEEDTCTQGGQGDRGVGKTA